MSKTYSELEIDALVKEVQEQFLSPLFKSAEEELAKAEKKVESAKEGGNGTTPQGGAQKGDGGNGPRSDALKSLGSLGKEDKTSPEGSRSDVYKKGEKQMAKEESSVSESSSESPMAKEESSPMAKEASDEVSPAKDSASPESASASAPPAPDQAPGEEAAPDAAPDAHPETQDGAGGDLLQAYSQLDDDSLKAHFEAISEVIKQKMGMGGPDQGMGGSDAMGAPPMAPPAPAMGDSVGGPPPAPATKMAPPMAPMMRSEKTVDQEVLAKTENLQKQVEGLTQVLEMLLAKPERKSITSMAEYVAKSESEKPQLQTLSKSEIRAKLERVARDPSLKKSDQDLIVSYFLDGNVKVKDIEHLLK